MTKRPWYFSGKASASGTWRSRIQFPGFGLTKKFRIVVMASILGAQEIRERIKTDSSISRVTGISPW